MHPEHVNGYPAPGAGRSRGQPRAAENGAPPARRRSPTRGEPYTLKLLTSQPLAASIIGRGGSVIAKMRLSCNAKVFLSEAHEIFAQTECRVLTARADSEEALNEVSRQVIERLADLSVHDPPNGSGRQLKLSALLPKGLVPAFIGPGGSAIRQLCETSHAMIKVQQAVGGVAPEATQEVQFKGTEEALERVLKEVVRRIPAVHGESWFTAWASASQSAAPTSPPPVSPSGGTGASLENGSTHARSVSSAPASASPELPAAAAARPGRPPAPAARSARDRGDAHAEHPDTGEAAVAAAATADERESCAGKCAIKLLTPPSLAAAIIGKGGTVIEELRQRCQARIDISQVSEIYPRSDCRVLTAIADTMEAINKVTHEILEILKDVASRDPSDKMFYDGQLKLSSLVPRAAVGPLIGAGGSLIKQLCDQSGAAIKIRDPAAGASGLDATQEVQLRGVDTAIEYALKEVARHIAALSGDPWFPPWVMSPTGLISRAAGAAARAGQPGSEHAPVRANPSRARSAGTDLMNRVIDGLPTNVMEESRGFALTCIVPGRLVGPIMGRGGMGVQEVQNFTKTTIAIREIPQDPDNRSMSITGPLLNACSAYMLMMRRYLDAEKELLASSRQGKASEA